MMNKLKGLSEINKMRVLYLPMFLITYWIGSSLFSGYLLLITSVIAIGVTVIVVESTIYLAEKELKNVRVAKSSVKQKIEEFVASHLEIDVDGVDMIHKEGVVARVRVGEKVYEVLVGETTFLIIGGKIVNEGTDLVLENGGSVS